jgi:hypothetical protein
MLRSFILCLIGIVYLLLFNIIGNKYSSEFGQYS